MLVGTFVPDGTSVTAGVPLTSGFTVTSEEAVGFVVAVGFAVATGFFVVTGFLVVAGFFVVFFAATVILQLYFFFPITACTFAEPFFKPFTVQPVLLFLVIFTYFFPFETFHLTLFLLFLSFTLTVFPTVTFALFAILVFFAASANVSICTLEIISDAVTIPVRHRLISFFVLFFIIILTSAHFFAYQVCVRCAHTQILCVKNIIFHTMVPLF